MPREVKTSPLDRIADLEGRIYELERILRSRGGKNHAGQRLQVRLARTGADDYDGPDDATYPVQTDKAARLPIRFVEIDYDGDSGDVMQYNGRSAAPQAWVYSPEGWIPRGVLIEPWWDGRKWVVIQVPDLYVTLTADIELDVLPQVAETWHQGVWSGQEISVHYNKRLIMFSSILAPAYTMGSIIQSGRQCLVRLRRIGSVCKWEIIAAEQLLTLNTSTGAVTGAD